MNDDRMKREISHHLSSLMKGKPNNTPPLIVDERYTYQEGTHDVPLYHRQYLLHNTYRNTQNTNTHEHKHVQAQIHKRNTQIQTRKTKTHKQTQIHKHEHINTNKYKH